MLIDCNSCAARPAACSDCVVTVLLGPVDGELDLEPAEYDALGALAGEGLVPPLRMVPVVREPPTDRSAGAAERGGLRGTA